MKPRLLDLFCGAGGAAMGYHRAGFEVVGVDIAPQPHYPFEFHQGDARTWPLDGFDAIHASPPCQAYSTMGNRYRIPHPELLQEVLTWFYGVTIPLIVENVPGAKRLMPGAIRLTGGMFGLRVHRPRLFLSNVPLQAPPPSPPPPDRIGVYGNAPDGRRLWGPPKAPTLVAAKGLKEAQEAMGMDWADWYGTKEAIPPAYTEYIGKQLLTYLEGR